MSPEALEALDFVPYDHSFNFDLWDNAWCFTVRDEIGKRLHVHVRMWNSTKYGENHIGWDAWMQTHDSGGNTFDINLHDVSKMSPAKVVEWFCDAWSKLDCRYYEKWDGSE